MKIKSSHIILEVTCLAKKEETENCNCKRNQISVTDSIGVFMNMTYDSRGNVISATNGAGTTSFTYDEMDGLIKVSYPDGKYVEYVYDEYLRLSEIKTALDSSGTV